MTDLHPDGLWHARYPTASRTLCGLVALDRPERALEALRPPSCVDCAAVAAAWMKIDSTSSPPHFEIGRCEGRTNRGSRCLRRQREGERFCAKHLLERAA